jgi:hypothetical protein
VGNNQGFSFWGRSFAFLGGEVGTDMVSPVMPVVGQVGQFFVVRIRFLVLRDSQNDGHLVCLSTS